MYPSPFEYRDASTVSEALELLAEAEGEVELLAGGHSLLPTMKSGLASPDVVIDISGIDRLTGIEPSGDAVSIGALTRYADIAGDERLWRDATVVAEAASEIGDIQVRNMGTIGGNVAHSDPASDLPGAVLAADATIHAEGQDGSRTIAAEEFFTGIYETALAPGELLTAVEVPTLGDHHGAAYVKKPSPASGYAMVGVAAVVETDGEELIDARIAANGAFDHASRLGPVEEALAGLELDDSAGVERAAGKATDDVEEFRIMDDVQATADFRAHLLTVYAERAITAAVDRAQSGAPSGTPPAAD